MKNVLILAVAAMALVATPVMAADVSKDTLNSLGLGSLKSMSDSEGMQVRGLSSNARATGAGGFSIFLFDVFSGSFAQLQGANMDTASEENGGNQEQSGATQTNTTVFSGLATTTIVTGGNTTTWTVGAFTIGAGVSTAAGN